MYTVIDEMCCETQTFKDKKEAMSHAANIQGVVYHENKVIASYC